MLFSINLLRFLENESNKAAPLEVVMKCENGYDMGPLKAV